MFRTISPTATSEIPGECYLEQQRAAVEGRRLGDGDSGRPAQHRRQPPHWNSTKVMQRVRQGAKSAASADARWRCRVGPQRGPGRLPRVALPQLRQRQTHTRIKLTCGWDSEQGSLTDDLAF